MYEIFCSHKASSTDHILFYAEKEIFIRTGSAKHISSDASCFLITGQLRVLGVSSNHTGLTQPVVTCLVFKREELKEQILQSG